MSMRKLSKTTILAGAIGLAATFGVVGAVLNVKVGNKLFKTDAAQTSFNLVLNGTSNTLSNAVTESGNSISFTSSGFTAGSGSLGSLAASGYFYNSTQISNIKTVSVNFSGAGTLTVYGGWSTSSFYDLGVISVTAAGSASLDISTLLPSYIKIANESSSAVSMNSVTFTYNCDNASGVDNQGSAEKAAVAKIGSTSYLTLDRALQVASSNSSADTIYVIPGTNPTLNSSRTINSADTLILPYDGTTYHDVYTITNSSGSTTGTGTLAQQDNATYMKLKVTIASGVTLTNSGTIYVGGRIAYGNGGAKNGGQTGDLFAQLTMENSSKLVCKNGSKTYVYGYITEKNNHGGDYADNANLSAWPSIDLESGALLNAPFVIHDFRGGSITSAIYGDRSSKHAMFINEFEMMNIKPLINIAYGATITVNTYLYVSGKQDSEDIKLIGNSSSYFFEMKSGSSMTFKYNYGNDNGTGASNTTQNNKYAKRYLNYMDIRINGNSSVNALSLKVGSISLDTSAYRLGLSYLYHLRFKNGTTSISNSMKMMDGSKLIIDSTATLTLSDMIVYDTYVDGSDGHAQYPTAAGKAQLINNGTLTATQLAGKVYTESASSNLKVTSGASVNCYEHLSHSGSSFSTSATYTTISENLQLKLIKKGSVGDFTTAGTGQYYGYKDSSNNYGWYTTSGTLSYDSNGSSDTFSDKSFSIDANGYTVTASDLANTPTRLHYTFGGWYEDQECTVQVTTSSVLYCSTTLYAKWTPVEYPIVYHFDKNFDGTTVSGTPTNSASNPSTYNIEDPAALYPASYGDYIFDGWYSDSSYSTKISTITGDILSSLSSPYTLNLYGRWYPAGTETYTITYSNSNTDEGCTCIASEDILSVNISKYSAPVLSGKNSDTDYSKYFDGWYMDSEFNTKYTSTSQITSSCVLYAHWLEKNEVTVTLPGVPMPAIKYLNANTNFTVPDPASYGIEVPTGYTMKWTISGGDLDGNTYSTGDSICLSTTWGNHIGVTGEAEANSVSLTIKIGTNETGSYKVNGGTAVSIAAGKSTTITVKTGDSITLTVTPSDNYTAGAITASGGISGSGPYTITGTGAATLTAADAEQNGCLVAGTLITMADGSQKAVEDIALGDMVRTWDFETGSFSVKPVIYIEKSKPFDYKRINVEFDDGTELGIIGQHTLFDLNARDYFVIDGEHIESSIGREVMADADGSLSRKTITNITVSKENGSAYEIVTGYDMNFVSNGVVSAEGMIIQHTFFDVDEDYKYDAEAKANDIATYGLFTYEEFADVLTPEQFELLNGPYFKVGLAKGYYSEDFMRYMIERFKTTGGMD